MKRLALLMMVFFAASTTRAQQKKNIVQIQSLGNYVPTKNYKRFSFYPMDGLGIQYERRLFKKFGVALKYSFWMYTDPMKASRRFLFRQTFAVSGNEDEINERGGALDIRRNYKFVDLSGTYTIEIHRRHQFTFRQGLSFATGKDDYLYWKTYFQTFVRVSTETENGRHFGGVSDLAYDYSLWSQRINVGVNAGARYYFGIPWVNYSYGIHIAYCF